MDARRPSRKPPPPQSSPSPRAAAGEPRILLRPRELLLRLLRQADRNRDGRITAEDLGRIARSKGGRFVVPLGPGIELRVHGAERLALLANLLAQKAAVASGDHASFSPAELLVGRVDAALAGIEQSWAKLTRRADNAEDMIAAIEEGTLPSADGRPYLYVPETDGAAAKRLAHQLRRHPGARLVAFPRVRGAREHATYAHDAGIAYLPHPYLVPGGHFREMYGWDSYFEALGALEAGHLDLARGIAENLIYQVEHYGKIANTNRSYHLSRTQPPLLSRLVRVLYERLAEVDARGAREFLRRGAAAVARVLQEVWYASPRATRLGLARYCDEAAGRAPEVPAAFYADKPRDGAYYVHDRALRESGWDLTHRFGRAAQLHAPVCLNALLYQYESDLADFCRMLRRPGAASWSRRAAHRRRRIDELLWDEARGLYFDCELAQPWRRSGYESAATFFPLWVGAASAAQAEAVASHTERFLARGGIVTSTAASRETGGPERFQWDHPVGWAPLHVIAVEGLRRYGYDALADRIAYRWLWMVLRIAGEGNGLIVEKYDVVRCSAEVAAEYANQGSDRGPYLERDPGHALGFGWTNASVPLLLRDLSARLRTELDNGTPPGKASLGGE